MSMPTDEDIERIRNILMTDDDALMRFIEWVMTDHDDDGIPTTVEEVAKAEAEFDETKVVLPESLRDPMAILDRSAVTWEERIKRVQDRVIEAVRKQRTKSQTN